MTLAPDVSAATLLRLAYGLPRFGLLTPNEREEVVRIARGFTCKESAAVTNLAARTMQGWRTRIYLKLRVSGAAELQRTILPAAATAATRRPPALDAEDDVVGACALTHLAEDAEQLRSLERLRDGADDEIVRSA